MRRVTFYKDSIRETDMNGQIEGLEIGGEAVSLWNYKKAEAIKVCKIPH